jgi:hypothetical protein
MEYLRGWRSMREDPEWIRKIINASIILLSGMCIPVVGQIALSGWQSLILRRAVSGQDAPMPRLDLEFDYLGKLLNTGFKGFLAQLVWSIPVMVIVFGMMFCMGFIGVAGLGAAASAGASSGSDAGTALGGFGGLCFFGVSMVVYVVLVMAVSLPLQIARLRAELTDDVGSAMKFGEVIAMTRLLMKELIVGTLVLQAVGMLAGIFGIITLYIGLFPAVAVMMVLQTYYYAELYKAYLQKGGQPLPIGPLDVEGAISQPGAQPGVQLPPQF